MGLCGISSRFQLLSPTMRQVTHALLTRPPLNFHRLRRISAKSVPFDLHVLGTPPAFILSQDQTLSIIRSIGLLHPLNHIDFKFVPSKTLSKLLASLLISKNPALPFFTVFPKISFLFGIFGVCALILYWFLLCGCRSRQLV